jgi:chromosome segregation ATPase
MTEEKLDQKLEGFLETMVSVIKDTINERFDHFRVEIKKENEANNDRLKAYNEIVIGEIRAAFSDNLNNVDGKFGALNEVVGELKVEVTDVKTRLGRVEQKLEKIDNKLVGIDNKVLNFQDRLENVA